MHVHGMDVKNAFLHGKLDHGIYMQQPEGYIDKANPDYACKLHRAVYGLKQSPLQWYNTIRPILKLIGVKACPGDSGLFAGRISNIIVLLAIYVDDLFIACEDKVILSSVKTKLSGEFAMSDMGEIKHYLGMDINYQRTNGVVKWSQAKAIDGILARSECRCKIS